MKISTVIDQFFFFFFRSGGLGWTRDLRQNQTFGPSPIQSSIQPFELGGWVGLS